MLAPTILIGVILVTLYIIYRMIESTRKRQLETDQFLSEAHALFDAKLDTTAAEEYETKKSALFEAKKAAKGWTDERYEEDADVSADTSESWLRELAASDLASLKAALVKRAVAALPLMAGLQDEARQKFVLYTKGLISERQWNDIIEFRDKLNQETLIIRHEAESLQQGYGFDGVIFKEAATFHQHQMQKRMHEMQNMQQQVMRQRLAQAQAGSS